MTNFKKFFKFLLLPWSDGRRVLMWEVLAYTGSGTRSSLLVAKNSAVQLAGNDVDELLMPIKYLKRFK